MEKLKWTLTKNYPDIVEHVALVCGGRIFRRIPVDMYGRRPNGTKYLVESNDFKYRKFAQLNEAVAYLETQKN